MFLLDARGVLVFYNDAAALLIGRAYGEMGEIPAEEFGAVLHLRTADDKPLRRRDTPAGIAFFERRPAHRTVAATGYDGVQRLVHATAYPALRYGRRDARRRLGVLASRQRGRRRLMQARVWGCRGSVAAPGPDTVKYGGNTSCVEVRLSSGAGPRARRGNRDAAARRPIASDSVP